MIRENVLRSAEHRCQTCGMTETVAPLFCDEQWHYDEQHETATVAEFEVHCGYCYLGRHFGLAVDSNLSDIAFEQLCRVNRISMTQAQELYYEAVRVWGTRSKWKADVDVVLLSRYPQLQAVTDYNPNNESPMLERIIFDTSGWHLHERSNELVVWGKTGDILSVAVIPPAWHTFKRMEREYWLDYARNMAKPGGIVSLDSCTAADRPAIQIIYKRVAPDRSTTYRAFCATQASKTPGGLWASDHAGVAAQLVILKRD